MPFFSKPEKRTFNVVIYEEDYKELCAWVLKKPNIETGGDLFGLWADKHTAVIQLVLGPGKQCSRTTASFYQDIDYLRRVGSYLTQNEGVCHIGEWHSHHQLGLARPSGGDENTVWNNMPTYNLKRFVIFIANIQSSRDSYNVNVGCFLFEIDDKGKHMDVLPGKFTILQKNSPLSEKREVTEERKKGAEKDDENKIAIKELKMEMNEGGKRPSVTCLKPIPAPSVEIKRGKRGNHSQLGNQNKPNDEESSIDSKKRKMNTKETSSNKTPVSGKKSGEGSPLSEDLENLTINNKQPDETSEEAMEQEQEQEQEQEKEQPMKISQEEIKHEEQHDGESGRSQGNKAGRIKKSNEASPPQAEQEKTEKEGKQRPLPELGTESTPEAKTQKQKEDEEQAQDEEQAANRRAAQSGATTEETFDSKDDPSQGSNKREKKEEEERSQEAIEEQDEKELQGKKNQEELRPDGQHDGEKGKSQMGGKEENIKGKAVSPQAKQKKVEKESKPRVSPKPGKETKPAVKTPKKKDQDNEIPKTRAPQSGPKKAGSSQTASTKSAKKQK